MVYFKAKTSNTAGKQPHVSKIITNEFVVSQYKMKYWLPLILFSLLTACGYYNPHTVADKSGQSYSVYAPQWKNQTNELGLEAVLNHAVHDWLSESRIVKLTSSASDADYLLHGIIQSINTPGLSYGTFDQATEVRAELKVLYTLKERKTGKTVFSKNSTEFEAFQIGTDAPHTRTNKESALNTIADRFGEAIHLNIFYALTKNKRHE